MRYGGISMISVEEIIRDEYHDFFNRVPDKLSEIIVNILKLITHEQDINEFLMQNKYVTGFDFVELALEYLDVAYKVSSKDKENIPPDGKVIIIANHPLGAVDAMALIKLVAEVRKDVKVLANGILSSIENIRNLLIPVDNIRGKLTKISRLMIEEALNNEEALIIFPAGEVSRVGASGIKDVKWKSGFLKIARKFQTPILPVFIDAKNSFSFYLTSIFWKNFSTFLLPHEMMKFRSRTIEFRVGELIPFENFKGSVHIQSAVKLFKKHLYKVSKGKSGIFVTQKCTAHPESRQFLKKELKKADFLGTTSDGKKIYLVYAQDGLHILREIGRLREYAFRKVGEGTGKRRDLDEYDTYYAHLFLWDDEALEIVGAYRIGESGKIIKERGEKGFYLRSLCKFKKDFQPYLRNSIELGRSFVQPKYWGSRALDYLWLGIGAYLRKNPDVRYIFGPVSISPVFSGVTKDALIYFYSHYYGATKPALEPNEAYRVPRKSIEEFKAYFYLNDYKKDLYRLKKYLKQFGLSIPTLYKQYCDMFEPQGVRFHGFGVDREFGGCVDGYLVADLTKLKYNKRKRYIESI